jgi:hypothetical protein
VNQAKEPTLPPRADKILMRLEKQEVPRGYDVVVTGCVQRESRNAEASDPRL